MERAETPAASQDFPEPHVCAHDDPAKCLGDPARGGVVRGHGVPATGAEFGGRITCFRCGAQARAFLTVARTPRMGLRLYLNMV